MQKQVNGLPMNVPQGLQPKELLYLAAEHLRFLIEIVL